MPEPPDQPKPLRGMVHTVGLVDETHFRPMEKVIRPLLDLLQRVTGLDSTYVTMIDRDSEEQQVLFSRNAGSLQLPEGTRVPWADALCRRALEVGPPYPTEVPKAYPNSQVARSLGVTTFVMHPIVSGDQREIIGALCGMGSSGHRVDDDSREILAVFADIIGRRIDLEHAAEMRESGALAGEQRIHERAQFLAIAQHALKTPLTVIYGWAHFLKTRRETALSDAELEEGIDAIWRNANSLAGLVDEMLEEASADAHARELHIQAHDLAPFLKTLSAEFNGISNDHPIVADVPLSLEARFDRAALHQALGYLLVNAIKYSPSGGQIVLRASSDGDRVVIAVVDRGAGIPPGLDLFAPFTRGDESVPGAGLGLHIARMIVESMSGAIDARRNVDGPGSTFRLHLKSATERLGHESAY